MQNIINRYTPVLLAVFFVAAILPTIGTLTVFHPDERHYSEAAIHMLDSGCYMTPVDEYGHPRLVKPILTYWFVALSYLLLGITPFAMRLPSLLAGGFTVYFSYRLGHRVSGDQRVGLISALVVMSNVQFIMAAGRANPDIFLTLFMLLSYYGFSGLLLHDGNSKSDYWYAYIGAALAVAVKGLLAGVFVGYIWLFVLFDRDISFKRVLHWPSIISAVLIASWWFVVIKVILGTDALHGFVHDQVGRGMRTSIPGAMGGMLHFGYQEIIFMFPWSFVALECLWKAWRDKNKSAFSNRAYWRLVLPWIVLGMIIFGLNSRIRIRYMLPFVPLLAAGISMIIVGAEKEVRQRAIRHQVALVTGLIFLVSLLAAVIHTEIGRYSGILIIALFCGAIYAGLSFAHHSRLCLYSAIVLGFSMLVGVPIIYLSLTAILTASPAEDVEQYLALHATNGTQVYCITKHNFYAKLRMLDHERLNLRVCGKRQTPKVPTNAVVVVLDSRFPDFTTKIPEYTWVAVSSEVGKINPGKVLDALFTGSLKELLNQNRDKIYVGVPEQEPVSYGATHHRRPATIHGLDADNSDER